MDCFEALLGLSACLRGGSWSPPQASARSQYPSITMSSPASVLMTYFQVTGSTLLEFQGYSQLRDVAVMESLLPHAGRERFGLFHPWDFQFCPLRHFPISYLGDLQENLQTNAAIDFWRLGRESMDPIVVNCRESTFPQLGCPGTQVCASRIIFVLKFPSKIITRDGVRVCVGTGADLKFAKAPRRWVLF